MVNPAQFITINTVYLSPMIHSSPEAALIYAVRKNKEDERHPKFWLYEMNANGEEYNYKGYLHRDFGSDTFSWRTE